MADPRVERRANLVVQLGAVNVANKVGLRVIVGISCPQSRLPGLIGPKNQGQVTSDPQVRGVDLFGNSRLVRGQCDVGAIEVSFPETLASSLGITRGQGAASNLVWLMPLLLFLLFLFLGVGWKRRRRLHQAR